MLCFLHCDLLVANQAQRPNQIQQLIDRGKRLRDSGQLTEAISFFARARDLARQQGDQRYEARSLILSGSAQTLNFQYSAALNSLDQASQLGERLNDPMLTGPANANLATLYGQLGDFLAAEARARYAIKRFKEIATPDPATVERLARSLLIHASVCFDLGKALQGFRDYDDAFRLAKNQGNTLLQALILDKKGAELTRERRVDEAGSSLQQALQISQEQNDSDGLAFEKEHLAELEIEKVHPNLAQALSLINQSFTTPSPAFKTSPQYYPLDIRGKILLQSGDKSAALSEFMKAVGVADRWRSGALPGDATNTETVRQLQSVYADYSQLAAETAIENNDNALAAKALEVLAANRAASLREQLRVVYGANGRLPDEYFEKLAELQAAQGQVTLGQNSGKDQAKLMQIRLDISDLENKIGIKSEKITTLEERIPRRNSLRDIQRTLTRDQVLISITLGKSRSYMWAITSGKVNLSRLPGEGELTSITDLLASGIRNGHDASAYAGQLTHALFSGLPPDVWNRSEWMLVADGELLNGVPFCALPNLGVGTARKLLIEDKSIRFLPGELLLTNRPPSAVSKKFVGVGDPIYNQADARLVRSRWAGNKPLPDGITLARLVGSEQEIRSAAKEADPSDAVILTGVKATREDLSHALKQNVGVLHFAVHVVSPPDEPQQAALALSLKNGIPELLTPEVVSSFRVPGSLVVLSGCSSGQGKIVPGTGLVGLSRAWLLAGAAAVLVSSWPTPDDSGKFFSAFYDHFDQITTGDTAQRAALALRRTQLDMLHGTGYQTSPSFWGAFAVIAKE